MAKAKTTTATVATTIAVGVILSGLDMEVLAEIVAAGVNGMYYAEADLIKLRELGYVEVGTGLNEAGELPVRATAEGVTASEAYVAGPGETGNDGGNSAPSGETKFNTQSTAPAANLTKFTIEDNVAMPVTSGRTSRYPFDALAVGQSFAIPATDEVPNPAKALASTVSGATKRYKDIDGRKFKIRAVEGGARVWRTE